MGGLSSSKQHYSDIGRALETALANLPDRTVFVFQTSSQAQYWRQRANKYRTIIRKENTEAFAGTPQDFLCNTSPFDELTFLYRFEQDEHRIIVQRVDPGIVMIRRESCSTPHQVTQLIYGSPTDSSASDSPETTEDIL